MAAGLWAEGWALVIALHQEALQKILPKILPKISSQDEGHEVPWRVSQIVSKPALFTLMMGVIAIKNFDPWH